MNTIIPSTSQLKKAFAGDIQAQTDLGLLYERAWTWTIPMEEADINRKKALYWYTMAAHQGMAEEKEQLANFYYKLGTDDSIHGAVFPCDAAHKESFILAAYWYEQAAVEGLASSQYLLL